jgi:hypothetical protein
MAQGTRECVIVTTYNLSDLTTQETAYPSNFR